MLFQLSEQIVNGLVTGSVYAIVAVGMTMIFGVLRAINFAHGEYYMLGTFGAWVAIEYFDLPYPLSVAVGVRDGLVMSRRRGLRPQTQTGSSGGQTHPRRSAWMKRLTIRSSREW